MLHAHVTRTQHPIGHGGFHTGNLRIFSEAGTSSEQPLNNFWYVYDCGSEDKSAFKRELMAHRRSSNGRTDILFVSHLHSDHINGIERLLAMAPAATVVVPYLDVVDRLVFLLDDIERGRANSSAREYFEDPAAWWGRRGVNRVIFLEPGPPNGQGPTDFPEPDAPFDGPFGEGSIEEIYRLGKNPTAALADRLVRPRSISTATGLGGEDENIRRRAFMAKPGSHFSLQWRTSPKARALNGDWILLPYVHPVATSARAEFQKALRQTLGVGIHRKRDLIQKLLTHLFDFQKTKTLVDLYGDHFGHGHNAISMSLYSGPASALPHQDGRQGWIREWLPSDTDLTLVSEYFTGGNAVGWLKTGDSELKQRQRRDPWREFYESFSSQIGLLNLPHHGSLRNFHEEILGFEGLELTVATTIARRRRVSKLHETIDLVEAAGKTTVIVDALEYRRLQVSCSRTLQL